MFPLKCVLIPLLTIALVHGEFTCICNYDEETPVLAHPDPSSSVLDHMYEFDCKPIYRGQTGGNYTALQIGGKIGYVRIQQQIQEQTCGGAPSPADLIPTTSTQPPLSTTQMPMTINTTQMQTTDSTQLSTIFNITLKPTMISTTQRQTAGSSTSSINAYSTKLFPTNSQMPITVSTTQTPTTVNFTTTVSVTATTTHLPSTQTPTTVNTTTVPITATTTHLPSTQTPTTVDTTTVSVTATTTHLPSTQTPTTVNTTTVPITASTTHLPSTQTPTTVKKVPITASTTQMPTTVTPTQTSTTVDTTHTSITASITQIPTTVSTPQVPTTMSTTLMPITASTTMSKSLKPLTDSITPSTMSTIGTTLPYHKTNVTNSVLKYIGISYNLTNGNPIVGTGTPSMTDPGLLLGNQVFQLNEYPNATSREVEVTDINSTCTTFYSLLNNGKSYQEELSTLVRPTGGHPQQLTDAAFMFNQEFNTVRLYTEDPHNYNVYQDVVTLCSQRKLRLKDEMNDREPISITRDFAKDACVLPVSYDVTEYVDFLDKWGTSIVIEAILGTKQLKRYQTTEADIFKAVDKKNSSLFQHAGAYMTYASSLTLSRQDYVNQVAQTADLGPNSTVTLMDSRHGDLVPVGLKLVPITFAFDWKYWKNVLGEFITMGVCSDDLTSTAIQHMADNINKTLQVYFAVKNAMSGLNVPPLKDSNLQMPVTWPKGTYGLMKPKDGCPMGHVVWHEGWRVQDSSHINLHHQFSAGISNTLSGTFTDRIQTYFCVKTKASYTPYDRDWPKGNYCLLKKGQCPTGFTEGSIFWDDKDILNSNGNGGTMPDGRYNENTKIYYCCRNGGPTLVPITLPVDRPFVLLRYKGACQQVYAMSMREVYIEWDTSDFLSRDTDTGAHPLDDGGEGHRLYFCFYYFNTGGVMIG